MSIADKVRSAYGIEQFLRKHDYVWKRKELNNLFLEFAEISEYKEHFVKNNSKNYRGSYDPAISNAHLISLNCFKEFKQWFIKNKKT
jgi:hypothetical protein